MEIHDAFIARSQSTLGKVTYHGVAIWNQAEVRVTFLDYAGHVATGACLLGWEQLLQCFWTLNDEFTVN